MLRREPAHTPNEGSHKRSPRRIGLSLLVPIIILAVTYRHRVQLSWSRMD